MKYLISPFIGVILSPLAAFGQAQTDYINWIRQIHTEVAPDGSSFNVVQDLHVNPVDVGESQLGIPEGGSFFQLWTLDSTNPGSSWLLDTATVNATQPLGTISVVAPDSNAGVARTIAGAGDGDRGFQVDHLIENLLAPSEGIPEGLTAVRIIHIAESSNPEAPGDHFIEDQLIAVSDLDTDSVKSFSYEFSNIPGPAGRPEKASGTEYFIVERIFGEDSLRRLDIARLEVSPEPDGNFTYSHTPNTIPEYVPFEVNDPFPGSIVFVDVTVTSPDGTEVTYPEQFQASVPTVNFEDFLEEGQVSLDGIPLSNGDTVSLELRSEFPSRELGSTDKIFSDIIHDDESFLIELKMRIRANITDSVGN